MRHPSDSVRFVDQDTAAQTAAELTETLAVELFPGVSITVGWRGGSRHTTAVIRTPALSVVMCADLADE